jgi:hypothetical protein
MNENDQDRSQSEGQEGIDKETELRNQENETGQQQNQQFGQQGSPSPSDQQRGEGFGEQAGQAVERSDTDLAERQDETDRQQPSSEAGGFVGAQGDTSGDYLTKGEDNPDFAEQGQGAQDTSAAKSDIETGQATDRDPSLDDGSNR